MQEEKSMESDGIYPGVPRELVEELAKLPSIIYFSAGPIWLQISQHAAHS